MTLEQYKKACGLTGLSEIERVCYLAFFHLKTSNAVVFNVAQSAAWLVAAGGAAPNKSRLEEKIRASSSTVKADGGWRLRDKFVEDMESKYPQVGEKSQEVVDSGTILPAVDYAKAHGYVQALAQQINASYEHNLFDGCAVLMRRLLEVMLILTYRKLGIENDIRDSSGNYQLLEGIANNAKTNGTLGLSRNSKDCLETFRKLGNFSAHKIEYTCRREYIKPHIQEYRAVIVELLHKSGLGA